jgi:hypothetical protein
MIRKVLFGALAALALASGMLMMSAIPGDTAPVLTMSTVPHVQVNNDLIQVKACGSWNNWCQPMGPGGGGNPNCGPWNNWCHPMGPGGGGGNSGCINLGGVQLCIGGSGPNCHWYNGVKYCNNQPRPRPDQCIQYNGRTYCSYKHNSSCVIVNGIRYCRY